MGCITVKIERASGLLPTVTRSDSVRAQVAARVSLVARVSRCCVVGQADYLMVTPDVVWLTDANNFTANYEVYSNIEWIIE